MWGSDVRYFTELKLVTRVVCLERWILTGNCCTAYLTALIQRVTGGIVLFAHWWTGGMDVQLKAAL